jgi:hypothetical protein
MHAPQYGIFALGTAAHAYLELDLRGGAPVGELVSAVADLREPRRTVGGVNLVAGFRPELWRDVAPGDAPAEVGGFNHDLVGADGYVMPATQHDAAAWESLPVARQEQAMGRTKLDSVELEDLPQESHVARTDQDRFGEVFRRNMPYGTTTDHGTMFVGFSAEQRRLAVMLESMAGLGDGVRDALTSYTRPLTGAYYFVPAAQDLGRFASA